MNVGVVSSQTIFRKALCALLVQSGKFSGVTEYGTDLDFADMHDKLEPMILVVHTTDPSADIDLVHEIGDLFPEARVILLVDNLDDEFCVQALEAGAWGCVSAADSPQVLVKALVKVCEGERWFHRKVTTRIIGKFTASRRGVARFAENLTSREWEVLALLANNHPDKEIADRLFISSGTVRSHLKSIYKKLQVSTRHAAAVYYFGHARRQARLSKDPEGTDTRIVK